MSRNDTTADPLIGPFIPDPHEVPSTSNTRYFVEFVLGETNCRLPSEIEEAKIYPSGPVIKMAAPANPWAPVAFDLSREYILTSPTPPIRVANVVTNSTTRSRFRLHWNWIAPWDDFGGLVQQYWNDVVPQIDKQRNVYAQSAYFDMLQNVATDFRVSNEGKIKVCIDMFVVNVHSAAATGRNGAPRPSYRHSRLLRWEQGFDINNNLAGIPDFVMMSEYADGELPGRITAMLEAKNPWQVTPALIDSVINSAIHSLFLTDTLDQVPLVGYYPARLAIEQLYGYMVRNAKPYGILTTMKGWCFLRRVNGGGLYITRMFGDFPARPGISHGAALEGYYQPTNFSIMKAIYYLSRLAEITNDLPETPIGGVPGQVTLPLAQATNTATPTIQQPQPQPQQGIPGAQGGYYGQGYQILGGYEHADFRQYHSEVDYKHLQFEPWKPENMLGSKNWIAKVLSDNSTVVLKLWDAWNFDAQAQNQEALVYEHLRSLWGKCIPSLRVKTALDYFHALIIQYIEVFMSLVGFFLMFRLVRFHNQI